MRPIGLSKVRAAVLALVTLVACTGLVDTEVSGSVTATAMAEPGKQEWQRLLGEGWNVMQSSHGTIRGSTLPVAVVLAEGTDPALVKMNDQLGASELDLNPRRLVMVERGPSGWRIWADFQGWLPSAGNEDIPCLLDPFTEGGVGVEGGSLQLAIQYFYSCGSWYITSQTFKFHREGKRLRLIGKESYLLHRATHDARSTSTNFLTYRQEITDKPGSIDEPETVAKKPKKTTRRIARKAWYIEDVDPDMCWERGENPPAWCDQ